MLRVIFLTFVGCANRDVVGKLADIMYELQTYGIPTQVFPIKDDLTISRDQHLDWLKRLRVQEMSGARVTAIVPRRFDVLFGKGKTITEHTGNLRAVHIVEMNREMYEKSGKYEKTQIAERIVVLINKSYGRFLKMEDGGWVEATSEEARDKISHYFRRLRETPKRGKSKGTSAVKREKDVGNGMDVSDTSANSQGESGKRSRTDD